MSYELKDKLNATTELLNELETKGWQEIEYLQTQIANLADNPMSNNLRQLFKNLLTSYYVFTGGIEILLSEPEYEITEPIKQESEVEADAILDEPSVELINDSTLEMDQEASSQEISEPFEYFVDFDEPDMTQPKLTDKELYNED